MIQFQSPFLGNKHIRCRQRPPPSCQDSNFWACDDDDLDHMKNPFTKMLYQSISEYKLLRLQHSPLKYPLLVIFNVIPNFVGRSLNVYTIKKTWLILHDLRYPSQLDSPREKTSQTHKQFRNALAARYLWWGWSVRSPFHPLLQHPFCCDIGHKPRLIWKHGWIQLPMNHRITKQSLPLHLTSPCNAKCQLLQEPCHCVDHAYLPIPSYSPACLLFTRGACYPIFADYWCSDFQFVRPMHHAGATMFLQ